MPLRFIQCAARSCMPQLARMMTPDRRTSERTIIFAGTVPETTTKHLTQQPHVKNQASPAPTHTNRHCRVKPTAVRFMYFPS